MVGHEAPPTEKDKPSWRVLTTKEIPNSDDNVYIMQQSTQREIQQMTEIKGIEKQSFDLKFIEAGKKNGRIFALVGDRKTKNEYMYVRPLSAARTWQQSSHPLTSRSWFGLTLVSSFPLLQDFRVSSSVDDALVFSVKSKMLGIDWIFEAPKEDIAKHIYTELTKVSQIAMTEKFDLSWKNHKWFEAYDVNEIMHKLEKSTSATGKEDGAEAGGSEGPEMGKLDQAMILFDDIKHEWIKKEMKLQVKEYSEKRMIYVHCGTWNVASNDAPEEMAEWLVPQDWDENGKPIPPDIYALGFQEVDMSAEAVILNDSMKGLQWEELIEKTLPPEYMKLCVKQLVGILLCVFIKKELEPYVSNLESMDVAVGLMGTLGNKGAVCVRFSLMDTTLVFLNAHLASGQSMLDRRNQDYRDVMRRISFQAADPEDPHESVFQQDHAFWLGDFNYRINGTNEEVRPRIKSGDREWLLKRDQLLIEKEKGTVFEGFREAEIKFDPTYKYDNNVNVYDTSEKKRIPAWCDRILWSEWSEKWGDKIENLTYRRHELFTSDHRPITALFKCPIRNIIGEMKNEVFHKIIRQLDRLENESMPDVTISTHSIDFGEVTYMVPVTRRLTMKNTGNVMLQWRFISKFNEKAHCKDWLFINPTSGILSTDEEVKLDFVLKIDKNSSPRLNIGKETLEDTLIIHLENGKDIFLSINGKYQRSCFGCSLEKLVCNPSSVRSSPLIKEEREMKLSIPRELWRMVDFIYHNGMETESLFLDSGDPHEIIMIREALDTGEDFGSKLDVHSFGEALIQFFDSLSDPVIPPALSARMMEHFGSYSSLKVDVSKVDGEFSAVHRNTFIYIVYFLREILAHSQKRENLAKSLAVIFSAVLFRDAGDAADMATATKKVKILSHFIESEGDFV